MVHTRQILSRSGKNLPMDHVMSPMEGPSVDLTRKTAIPTVYNIPANLVSQPDITSISAENLIPPRPFGYLVPVQQGPLPAEDISKDTSDLQEGQLNAEEIPPKNKPKCEICGKWFIAPWALKRHMPMHTGQKEWHCYKCDKYFTRKENLKMHIARYHLEDLCVSGK